MVTIKKGTEHTEEFQPKPDQSGLLTDEQIRIKLDEILAQKVKTYDAVSGEPEIISFIHGTSVYEDLLPQITELINIQKEAQRDLTASIKDADHCKDISATIDLINQGHQARIEALIEQWTHSIDSLTEFYECSNSDCLVYPKLKKVLDELKATHTRKEKKLFGLTT